MKYLFIYFFLTILYSIYKISCLHRKFKMDLLSKIPFELWDDILKYISDPETTLEKITQMYNNNPYVSISILNYINQILSSDNTKLWKHYLQRDYGNKFDKTIKLYSDYKTQYIDFAKSYPRCKTEEEQMLFKIIYNSTEIVYKNSPETRMPRSYIMSRTDALDEYPEGKISISLIQYLYDMSINELHNSKDFYTEKDTCSIVFSNLSSLIISTHMNWQNAFHDWFYSLSDSKKCMLRPAYETLNEEIYYGHLNLL